MRGTLEVKPITEYEKLFHWLLNKRGFYLSSEAEREDLMQELRVVYVIATRTFDPEKNVTFETYLTRCCHNRIGHLWEKRKHSPQEVAFSTLLKPNRYYAEDILEGDALMLSKSLERLLTETRFDVIDDADGHMEIERIVDSLEGRDREILQLFALGLTLKEVASRLGITRQAVHQRYQKIRLRLRVEVEVN